MTQGSYKLGITSATRPAQRSFAGTRSARQPRPAQVRIIAVFLSFAASSLNAQTPARSVISSERLSVTDFGAIPDGRTDNTAKLTQAFAYAASHHGTRLHFPCSNSGNTYIIRAPLAIPDYVSLFADGGEGCGILYNPASDPGTVNAAFTITGHGYATIDGLTLQTAASFPPLCILELARIKGNAGANKFLNVTIRGYATKALVYSLSSEVNKWSGATFRIMGGGAQYGFYTSSKDDLGICPECKRQSNLSIFFEDFSFVVEQPGKFTAIVDHLGGGTGDHYFERGYIGLNADPGSTGLQFISGGNGPNTEVSVKHIRIENGGFGFYFKKGEEDTLFNFDIEGVTWSSYVKNEGLSQATAAFQGGKTFFAYGDDSLKLDRFTMTQNIAHQHAVTGPSSFDSLVNSTVNESYGLISIRTTATGNIFMIRPPAEIHVPAPQRALNFWAFGNPQNH